jgi:Ca2+-transporting ATPase
MMPKVPKSTSKTKAAPSAKAVPSVKGSSVEPSASAKAAAADGTKAKGSDPASPVDDGPDGPTAKPAAGLTSAEAAARLRAEGPNIIEEHGRRSLAAILLGQLASPLVILLIVASVISIIVGDQVDAGIILIIVVLSTALGFVQEARSEGAVAALQARLALQATVIRDGKEQDLPARELVRGDVIVLNAGDIVPADGQLRKANHLYVDESALTGESAQP